MDLRLREFLVATIRSGKVHIKNFNISIRPPELQDVIDSYDAYMEAFEEARSDGLMDSKELEAFMLVTEAWTDIDDEAVKTVEKSIDNNKLELYEKYLNDDFVKKHRKRLRRQEKLLGTLMHKKNIMYMQSAEQYAEMSRLLFIVKKCCIKSAFDIDDNIDDLIVAYQQNILSDTEIRELCRTEPWRSLWSMAEKSGIRLFINEEPTINQRNIVLWSRTYDSVHESMDTPPKEVIEDDDFLDGWFVSQRRKREAEANKKATEDIVKNEKIKSSENVFIMASNKKEAAAISNSNDKSSLAVKQRRAEQLNKEGRLEHHKFSDKQAEYRKEIMEGFKKGNKQK